MSLLWWVFPNALAGMPMPFLHPLRRLNRGGELSEYDDDLSVLRAVVSLLNLQSDRAIYESAGFEFLCLPIADGASPSLQQATEFISFAEMNIAQNRPVAVHCEAGLGRTGTILATFLISRGQSVEGAITAIRSVEPAAIESSNQIAFLHRFANIRPT